MSVGSHPDLSVKRLRYQLFGDCVETAAGGTGPLLAAPANWRGPAGPSFAQSIDEAFREAFFGEHLVPDPSCPPSAPLNTISTPMGHETSFLMCFTPYPKPEPVINLWPL